MISRGRGCPAFSDTEHELFHTPAVEEVFSLSLENGTHVVSRPFARN